MKHNTDKCQSENFGNSYFQCNIGTDVIQNTYVEKDDPWLGILVAAVFEIFSTTNMLKGYGPVQLVFGRDMIFGIKDKVDWELKHP